MTDQTDRIKQMADQAHNWTDEAMTHDASLADPEAWTNAMYAKFAALVAEDCARVADNSDFGPIPHHIGDQIRARYAIAKPPEA